MSEPTHSIGQLRDALSTIINGAEDPSHYWGAGGRQESETAISLVEAALDELAILRVRVAEQDTWGGTDGGAHHRGGVAGLGHRRVGVWVQSGVATAECGRMEGEGR